MFIGTSPRFLFQGEVIFMNEKRKKLILKLMPVMIWIVLLVFFIIYKDKFSIESISSHTPENPLLAAVVLILLYGLKTLSMVFPLKVLQLSAGAIFPKTAAILVNTLGITFSFVVGYAMGKYAGTETVNKLLRKNQKLASLLDGQNNNITFFTFFLRNVAFLPTDTVSIYFGVTGANFMKYLTGSVIGMFPNVLISTFIGQKLLEPESPEFLSAILMYVVISVGSLLLYYLYKKNKEKKLANGS